MEQDYLDFYEHNGDVVLTINVDSDYLIKIGKEIEELCNEAYMNGYNWEVFIYFYIFKRSEELLNGLQFDSEAAMFVAIYEKKQKKSAKKLYELFSMLLENPKEIHDFLKQYCNEIKWE